MWTPNKQKKKDLNCTLRPAVWLWTQPYSVTLTFNSEVLKSITCCWATVCCAALVFRWLIFGWRLFLSIVHRPLTWIQLHPEPFPSVNSRYSRPRCVKCVSLLLLFFWLLVINVQQVVFAKDFSSFLQANVVRIFFFFFPPWSCDAPRRSGSSPSSLSTYWPTIHLCCCCCRSL